MRRPNLPKRLEKQIYQDFDSQCSFCGERDVTTLQVHHIAPWATAREHNADNLILVCSNCHQNIEAGVISENEVRRAKLQAASKEANLKSTKAEESNVISIGGNMNGGVVGNNVVINTQNKPKIVAALPDGSIASNLDQRNYIKYMIDKYHEFKVSEVGMANMRYPVFYNAIKKKFGRYWD